MEELVSKNASSLGYTIKKEQLDVVVQFLQGRDVFAILPTGFGKSLCFARLPGAFNVFAVSKMTTCTNPSSLLQCVSISGNNERSGS